MSYLLYCIFRSPAQPRPGIPPGVGGKPVFVLAQNGLSAGLSELAESALVPDISQTLAFERVVEHLYRDLTVIPVRYGCQLKDASEARWLLERHRDEYGALLNELEGLGEMGIHVLLDRSGPGTESDARPVPPQSLPLPCDSGAAYLAAKRQLYLGLDRAGRHERLLVEELWGSLAGLYVRRKVEFPDADRSRLLSLYFLVPRASVESFRRAARHLHPKEPSKLLLSGPWPPYNFVDSLER
ncbi:MAG: GvpL/GvpF family gas vesicle protein [Terriglobia bacterium]